MKPGVSMGLASALSLVLGIGLGRWLLDEERDARAAFVPAPAASPADSAEILAVLRGLERSLEALTRAVESHVAPSAAPVPTPRRETADEAPVASQHELASALHALSVAIRDLHDGKHAVEDSATAQLVTPPWIDREAVFLATGLRQAALTNGDVLESAEQAFRIRHLFKTYQEVLSTYGAPDDIEVNEPIREWTYENRFEGFREEIGFLFDNGTVCEAWYNCVPER